MILRKNKKTSEKVATKENTAKAVAKTLTNTPAKTILREIGMFGGIFIAVFIVSLAFVNANLLYHTVRDMFVGVQASEYTFKQAPSQVQQPTLNELTTVAETKEVKNILKTSNVDLKTTRESSLQAKTYEFSYSRIPPEHRLFIPSIGIDAPIVDINAASEEKLRKGDFMDELYSGVVKYPSTPEPGTKGNSLIFGHTSYYWRKDNPYGDIFAKMNDVQLGATVKVAWGGQLYTYEVIDKVIVSPSKVDEIYMKYMDGEYITLMGCYPVGSDAKRILLIAKRIPDKQASAQTIQ